MSARREEILEFRLFHVVSLSLCLVNPADNPTFAGQESASRKHENLLIKIKRKQKLV